VLKNEAMHRLEPLLRHVFACDLSVFSRWAWWFFGMGRS
jgi:hypothetical protein